MKKLIALLMAVLTVFSLAAVGFAESASGAITAISGRTDLLIGYDMMAGETRGEKATLIAYTADGTAEDAVWSSSDDSVVTVSSDGVIWAKGIGEAEITAAAGDSSMSVTVTVSENMTLDEVVDRYFVSLLDLGDTDGMTAEELTAKGDEYFYIPHSIEGTDDEVIEAAKNRTFTEQIAFYSKAEAYYNAALEKDSSCAEWSFPSAPGSKRTTASLTTNAASSPPEST